MSEPKKINIIRRFEIGVRRGVSKALEEHKRMGIPIVISKNGKIIKIPPEEIIVPHYTTDNEILDDIDEIIKTNNYENTSIAIRELAKMGIKLYNYREMMKDPKQSEEFQRKMHDLVQNDQVFDWTHTLSDSQIDGFFMAIQMEKEKRYELKPLR